MSRKNIELVNHQPGRWTASLLSFLDACNPSAFPQHTYLVPHRSPGNPDSSSQGWHRSCHSDSCRMSSHSSGLCNFLLKIMNKLEPANHKMPKHAPGKAPLSQDAIMKSNSLLLLGNQAISQRETVISRIRESLFLARSEERRPHHTNHCYFIWQLLRQCTHTPLSSD